MEGETAGLKSQIGSLKRSINAEEDKRQGLEDRAAKTTGVQQQERTLEELNKKVAEVYEVRSAPRKLGRLGVREREGRLDPSPPALSGDLQRGRLDARHTADAHEHRGEA